MILALLASGAYLWIRSPVDTVPYSDGVAADAARENTAWQTALLASGIDQAYVDVAPGTAYLAYDPPHRTGMAPDDWQWLVLGAAADTVTLSSQVMVVYYEADTPTLSWTVPRADLSAFAQGAMDRAAFEERISVQTLTT